jgi:hypothetical protein
MNQSQSNQIYNMIKCLSSHAVQCDNVIIAPLTDMEFLRQTHIGLIFYLPIYLFPREGDLG